MTRWLVVLVIGAAQAGEPRSAPAPGGWRSADEVLAVFDGEPDVRTVQRWAAEEAGVHAEAVSRWLRGARTFALLPQLRAEVRLRDDWKNDFRAFDPHGVPPTSDEVPIAQVLTGADVGQDRTVLVRATWDLDELVMSSERIRVLSEAQDAAKLREEILGEVTRLYFERRRQQVDLLLGLPHDVAGRVRAELRIRELTAALDAYTGGRFTSALAP